MNIVEDVLWELGLLSALTVWSMAAITFLSLTCYACDWDICKKDRSGNIYKVVHEKWEFSKSRTIS